MLRVILFSNENPLHGGPPTTTSTVRRPVFDSIADSMADLVSSSTMLPNTNPTPGWFSSYVDLTAASLSLAATTSNARPSARASEIPRDMPPGPEKRSKTVRLWKRLGGAPMVHGWHWHI